MVIIDIPELKLDGFFEDVLAEREAIAFNNAKLDKKIKENGIIRGEKVKHVIHCLTLSVFYLIFFSWVISFLVWLYHFLTPVKIHFLTSA